MEIELTAGWILAGLLVSTVGLGLFLYGKREARFPQLIGGIAMMVYPTFVESPAILLAIGAALVGGVCAAVRAGA